MANFKMGHEPDDLLLQIHHISNSESYGLEENVDPHLVEEEINSSHFNHKIVSSRQSSKYLMKL